VAVSPAALLAVVQALVLLFQAGGAGLQGLMLSGLFMTGLLYIKSEAGSDARHHGMPPYVAVALVCAYGGGMHATMAIL
jgi:hypothetical protein